MSGSARRDTPEDIDRLLLDYPPTFGALSHPHPEVFRALRDPQWAIRQPGFKARYLHVARRVLAQLPPDSIWRPDLERLIHEMESTLTIRTTRVAPRPPHRTRMPI